jgi:hypothetical protein
MKYNFAPKDRNIAASRMKVPDWSGRAQSILPCSSGSVASRIADLDRSTLRVRGFELTEESTQFEETGLMHSRLYDEPVTLNYSDLSNWARETTPVEDEPDVTDWMVPAKAAIAHLKARSNEYSRTGSVMTVASGDPFTPGVHNGQMTFKSERGKTVSDRGTSKLMLSGSKEVEVPTPGNTTVVEPNLLGWAAGYGIQEKQWIGSLMSIEELTNNPSKPIGFPNLQGNSGPLFVGHAPSRPSIINRVSVGIKSDSSQSLTFKLRDSRDYTRVLSEFNQTIPKGKSRLNFRTIAFGLSPMVAEIQPEDGTNTILTEYSVNP